MQTALAPIRWLVFVALAFGASLGVLALTLSSGQAARSTAAPRSWHVMIGFQSKDYTVQAMAFLPGDLWIDAGDTVVWTAGSGEEHMVTFLPPGQKLVQVDQTDPSAFTKSYAQGGDHYTGAGAYSSPIMSTAPDQYANTQPYQLTFDKTGNFTYYCQLHAMMLGHIHVRPAGTPYPYTQRQYDQMGQRQIAAFLRQGQALAQWAATHSSAHQVTLGIGRHPVSVMRFIPQRIVVHVGDTVTFIDRDPMDADPHTVNSGTDSTDPSGDAQHFAGGALSSGPLGFLWYDRSRSFKVTFTKAGVYAFTCAWHDDLNMKATVVVRS